MYHKSARILYPSGHICNYLPTKIKSSKLSRSSTIYMTDATKPSHYPSSRMMPKSGFVPTTTKFQDVSHLPQVHRGPAYIVSTPSGQVRRNQLHLAPAYQKLLYHQLPITPTPQSNVMTWLRSGAAIRPPERLTYRRKGDVA